MKTRGLSLTLLNLLSPPLFITRRNRKRPNLTAHAQTRAVWVFCRVEGRRPFLFRDSRARRGNVRVPTKSKNFSVPRRMANVPMLHWTAKSTKAAFPKLFPILDWTNIRVFGFLLPPTLGDPELLQPYRTVLASTVPWACLVWEDVNLTSSARSALPTCENDCFFACLGPCVH